MPPPPAEAEPRACARPLPRLSELAIAAGTTASRHCTQPHLSPSPAARPPARALARHLRQPIGIDALLPRTPHIY